MPGKTAIKRFLELPLTERIALIAVYAFLFFAWESRARAAYAFTLLLIACLLNRTFWKDLQRSRTIWLVALLLCYIFLRTLFALFEQPDYACFQLQDAGRLSLLAGFVIVGWILKGDQPRIFLALAVALLGFWSGRLEKFPWELLFNGAPWWQERMELGLPSAIAFGQYAAATAVGLLIMAPRILSAIRGILPKTLAVSICCLFLAVAIQGVILSQSRGVWLSLLVLGLLPLPLVIGFHRSVRLQGYRTVFIVGLVGILALGYLNSGILLQRVSTEADTIAELASGSLDKIESYDEKGELKSMGIRYEMILFGISHWQKNPLFGLGPGITEPLARDEWPHRQIKAYSDLHNGYIEILLRLGLIGSALIVLILALLFRTGWLAYREGRLAGDLLVLLCAGIALHLLGTLTNFRLLNFDWRYYWFLFGGILFSFDPAIAARSLPVRGKMDTD